MLRLRGRWRLAKRKWRRVKARDVWVFLNKDIFEFMSAGTRATFATASMVLLIGFLSLELGDPTSFLRDLSSDEVLTLTWVALGTIALVFNSFKSLSESQVRLREKKEKREKESEIVRIVVDRPKGKDVGEENPVPEPEEENPVVLPEQDFQKVALSLYSRARRADLMARWVAIVALWVAIGGAVMLVNSLGESSTATDGVPEYVTEMLDTDLSHMESEPSSSKDLKIHQLENLREQHFYNNLFVLVQRFGSVLFLLFIVQVMISLHRYNARLSSFYSGRGDVLTLAEGKIEDVSLKELAEILGGEKLEFGSSPKTPAQDLKEVVQAAVEASAEAFKSKSG